MTFFEELAEEKVVINPNKLNLWEPSCTQIDLQVQSPRFGVFWGILGHFGVFWPFWGILGHFGVFWATLGYFGPLWGILGHFGVFWATLGYFGPFAKKVGYFGPLPKKKQSV